MHRIRWACAAVAWTTIFAAEVGGQDVPRRLASTDSRREFDGLGTLVRNRWQGESDAPFALVDEAGTLKFFVYPPRGVDLESQLRRRVGVRGEMRKASHETAPHIWADEAMVVLGRDSPLRAAAHADAEPTPAGEELPPPGVPRSIRSASEADGYIIDEAPVEGDYGSAPTLEGHVEYPATEVPLEGNIDPYGDGPVLYPEGPQGMGSWGGAMPGQSRWGWLSGAWVRGEYLYWWSDGMGLPPLVTTSPVGTARASAGVLGQPGTSVLFGDSSVNNDGRSGGRLRFGLWFDPRQTWGAEAEYLALEDESTAFAASSTGTPILARPFFDMLTAQESAELIAFPNVSSGTVAADATTSFQSAGLRLRYKLCCREPSPPTAQCAQCGAPRWSHAWGDCGYRLDLIGGYRYVRLDDDLHVNEDLTSLDPQNPGRFVLQDAFETENRFSGGEIGTLWEMRRGRWSLELLSKIALGTNQQTVTIAGSTAITENGETQTSPGGLLAQRTNSGTFRRDVFAVVPELGATLGFQLTPRLRAVVGYSFIYWSRVVRAGDQIDLDLNPNLLPPEADPFAGPLRPRFAFRDTDFWAQGVSAGLDFRF